MFRRWMSKILSSLISLTYQAVERERKARCQKKYGTSFIEERREGNTVHRKTFITFADLREAAANGKDMSIGVNFSREQWLAWNDGFKKRNRPKLEKMVKKAYP